MKFKKKTQTLKQMSPPPPILYSECTENYRHLFNQSYVVRKESMEHHCVHHELGAFTKVKISACIFTCTFRNNSNNILLQYKQMRATQVCFIVQQQKKLLLWTGESFGIYINLKFSFTVSNACIKVILKHAFLPNVFFNDIYLKNRIIQTSQHLPQLVTNSIHRIFQRGYL